MLKNYREKRRAQMRDKIEREALQTGCMMKKT